MKINLVTDQIFKPTPAYGVDSEIGILVPLLWVEGMIVLSLLRWACTPKWKFVSVSCEKQTKMQTNEWSEHSWYMNLV